MTRIGTVLWDIDGTLLTAGWVAGGAFLDAVEQVAGARPVADGLDFGGRIDPEIAAALLDAVGADAALVEPVLARFRDLATERVRDFDAHVTLLPGVPELVAQLAGAGVTQTVVTGNLALVGRMKLAAAQLDPPIEPDLGGFGDDGRDRLEVAAAALRRLADAGRPHSLRDCWIVGDTPRDLTCARLLGVRCALVGTGRRPAASMAELGADLLLDDLQDTEVLLRLWEL
ncbi:HAD family hydrolase [Nakamurella leprariae]|uniref:Haloacid dehalogenase-like hydrolase n=1 Tax=Nakamurella leprariae TaxID=2803911 RepID=A0A938YA34_9ACTN|nr:haloacid dehalogenase-like hydrolase [Nakamurella leprariae]MBM9465816.1 haloacid dehalogenase-like hydrolase [Nakamurella leprariae]